MNNCKNRRKNVLVIFAVMLVCTICLKVNVNAASNGITVHSYDEFWNTFFEQAGQAKETFAITVKGKEAKNVQNKIMYNDQGSLKFNNNLLYDRELVQNYGSARSKMTYLNRLEWYIRLDSYTLVDESKTAAKQELSLVFETKFYITQSEFDQSIEKAKDALISLNLENMNDRERITAVSKWICQNIEFDYDSSERFTDSNGEGVQNAHFSDLYGGMIEGKAVCEGYSAVTEVMLHLLGYEVSKMHSPDHSWNVVKLDGNWYGLDNTWNDNSKTRPFGYILVGTDKWSDSLRKRVNNSWYDLLTPLASSDYTGTGTSLLKSWLIRIEEANQSIAVGKSIDIPKDRLTTVTSSNPNVVEVVGGKLVAKNIGHTIITRRDDKYQSQYHINVKEKGIDAVITLSNNKYSVCKGKTVNLKVKVTNADGLKAGYSSSNKKVAAVTQSGIVKAKSKGTVAITVKVAGVTKKIKIIVK